MLNALRKKKAQSAIEYVILISFILAILIVFQKYIFQAFNGRFKSVGDSFGQGRLYSPRVTTECAYDHRFTNKWYNAICFDENCFTPCVADDDASGCPACINTCLTPKCTE